MSWVCWLILVVIVVAAIIAWFIKSMEKDLEGY
jgi:hypothetical protein